jgi:hypothetical protein
LGEEGEKRGGRRAQGEEVAQTMYTHMNKYQNNKQNRKVEIRLHRFSSLLSF